MKYKTYFLSLMATMAAIGFLSCEEEGFPVTLEIGQVERLLTADSNKVWIPVEGPAFSPCALDNQYRFSVPAKKNTLGSFDLTDGALVCSDGIDTEQRGSWAIDTSEAVNQLIIYAQDTSTYEIDLITATKLQIKANQKTRVFVAGT